MQYRLYKLTTAEMIVCEADTDATAIRYALTQNFEQNIEIWQAERIVGYVEASH